MNVNRLIELTFADFDLRDSSGCLDHFVQAFDGHFSYWWEIWFRFIAFFQLIRLDRCARKFRTRQQKNSCKNEWTGFKIEFLIFMSNFKLTFYSCPSVKKINMAILVISKVRAWLSGASFESTHSNIVKKLKKNNKKITRISYLILVIRQNCQINCVVKIYHYR